MALGWILGLLLSVPAAAQQGTIAIDRFLGLNDTDSAPTLLPYEAQAALNTESNLQGTAIKKRDGYSRSASLTITTASVSGSHAWTCDNGDEAVVVCHDIYCAKSVNGAAFTNFLSTASRPARWSFVDVDGDLYGANSERDAVFKYDCTNLTHPAEIPAGSILAMTNDRLVVGDTSANPSRLSYSKSGDFTEFTTGSEDTDPWTDDMGAPGDRITGLFFDRGRLHAFKRTSITTCIIGDQYTTQCFPVSNNIGTQDPASIVSAPDGIYFRGQDRNYWKLSENGLEPISLKISNFVKNQAAGSNRSNTQTTEADWDAGSQSPSGTWDTERTVGSIVNSSVTLASLGLDTSFSMTDVDTTTFVTEYVDYFDDGDLTSGISWTNGPGLFVDMYVDGGVVTSSDTSTEAAIEADMLSSSGTWSAMHRSTASGNALIQFFVGYVDGDNGSLGYNFDFNRHLSANNILLTISVKDLNGDFYESSAGQFSGVTPKDGNFHNYVVSASSSGFLAGYVDGNLVHTFQVGSQESGTPISTGTYGRLFLRGRAVQQEAIDAVKFPYFYEYQVSDIVDASYSTPTYGAYSFTGSTSSLHAVDFYIQASSASDGGGFNALGSFTPGEKPTNIDSKRYIRHRIATKAMLNSDADVSSVTATSISAVSTATFRTQCIQPGSGISAWGILSCAEVNVGNGSQVYYATSAVSCAALPSTNPTAWTEETNNATLTIDTGAALYIGWRSLLGSATDQAQVDACTVYWDEGTVAQPAWGVYDSIRNAIYWTATTTASTTGDRIAKYDLNLGYFYPFDLKATALRMVGTDLYFGSSDGGYWNKYGGVSSDNGSDINAYWKSKDFAGGDPFQDTQWKTLSLVAKNQVTGNMTTTHSLSNGVSGSHTTSLSTTSARGFIRDNYYLPLASPANFINVQVGNNSATPFEVLGLRLDYHTQPWRPVNP